MAGGGSTAPGLPQQFDGLSRLVPGSLTYGQEIGGVDIPPADMGDPFGTPPPPSIGDIPGGNIPLLPEVHYIGTPPPSGGGIPTMPPVIVSGVPPSQTAPSGGTHYPAQSYVGMPPGTTAGLGSFGGGTIGRPGWQNAMFHAIWSGNRPLPYDTWRANQAWQNYQGSVPFKWNTSTVGPVTHQSGIGGSYQNYLDLWHSLRLASPQAAVRAGVGDVSVGAGGGGGRMTAAR